MMRCEEFTQKLTDYLEDKLPYGQQAGMWIHMLMCEHCRRYYEQLREVVEYAGELDSEAESNSLDDETKESLMDAYKKRVEDE